MVGIGRLVNKGSFRSISDGVCFLWLERGETNPTISTLYVLAQALKVELKDLIDVKFKKS